MSAGSVEDIRKHVRVYVMVFVALAVLTAITVAVAEFHFLTVPQAVAIALFVAVIKGSLVACYFMHLISERGMVLWVLLLCAFFFITLLLIPVLTTQESVGV